jgi:hypothetical protein
MVLKGFGVGGDTDANDAPILPFPGHTHMELTGLDVLCGAVYALEQAKEFLGHDHSQH